MTPGRFLRTTGLTTAALAAAVLLYAGLTVPPAAMSLTSAVAVPLGAYHIHTARSDGTGTVDEIAAAASRAGLSFVIFTDHGDGTRAPDPPTYRHGVLCIDALEISTTAGHVVALGLTGAAPYPLAGSPRDVIEDIHRLGGQAVIAHPDSPNPELRWRAQNIAFDGIEWLNVDSEWRDDTPVRLVMTAARALFRSPESMATLFARPIRTLERWDVAASRRPIFGLAALDAHANIAWQDTQEPRLHTALARPSYESMFRTVAQVPELTQPLTGDATNDARTILDALIGGRSFSLIRAFASPATLTFVASQGTSRVAMGQRLESIAPTTFTATVPQAPGATLTIYRNGQPVISGRGLATLDAPVANTAGVYRVEATLPGITMPWMVSNPIVIGASAQPPAPDIVEENRRARTMDLSTSAWAIERSATSTGAVTNDGSSLKFGFSLGKGKPAGQYAAAVTAVGTDQGISEIQFTGRADRPMRASVQVRLPRGASSERWRRSIYLDPTPRVLTIKLEEFEPADAPTTRRPIAARLQTLLLVVDTLNSVTGTSGTIWMSDMTLR